MTKIKNISILILLMTVGLLSGQVFGANANTSWPPCNDHKLGESEGGYMTCESSTRDNCYIDGGTGYEYQCGRVLE